MNKTECNCGVEKEKPKTYADRHADTLESIEVAICPSCDDTLFTIIDVKKNEEGA